MTKRQERKRGRVSELELFIVRESSSLSSSRRRRARERERKRKSMRQKRKKQHTCIAANYCATGTEYNRRRTTTNAKMYARARAVRRRRRRLMRTPNAQCCEKIKNVYNIILIHKAFYGNLVRTGSLYSLESIGCASLRWKMVNEF